MPRVVFKASSLNRAPPLPHRMEVTQRVKPRLVVTKRRKNNNNNNQKKPAPAVNDNGAGDAEDRSDLGMTAKQLRRERERQERRKAALQRAHASRERVLLSLDAQEAARFVALDVEAYEHNQKKITEIGLSIYAQSSGWRNLHYIVAENCHLRNGKYVEDNQDNFGFGESIVNLMKEVTRQVAWEVQQADFIVGHAIGGDLQWLKSLGVQMGEDTIIVDTQQLALTIIDSQQQLGLQKLADHLNIPTQYLHNAGNDAVYTLAAMFAICGYGCLNQDIGVGPPSALPARSALAGKRRQREAAEAGGESAHVPRKFWKKKRAKNK